MFDKIIRNGTVVFPGRPEEKCTLAIKNGKICGLFAEGEELAAVEVIDASGKHIFPGVIEPHSHLGLATGKDDFVTETSAAALGGVTTVLFFLRQPLPYDDTYREIKTIGEKKSYIDFSFHITLLTEEHLSSIPHYVKDLGVTSFKIYFTYRGVEAKCGLFGGDVLPTQEMDDGFVLDCFTEIAKHPRALAIVHAENVEIITRVRNRLKAEGLDDMDAYSRSRPPVAEAESINRALFFAMHTGCEVNILHLSSQLGLEMFLDWHGRYPKSHVEMCHIYLSKDSSDATTSLYRVRPPLRSPKDRERLWQAVMAGEVDSIGTDHVARKAAEKAGSVWTPAAGFPGTQYLFLNMLERAHNERGMSLSNLAELLSLRPAKLYGLYPQKGDLLPGFDADLIVVDLEREIELRMEDFPSFSDYNVLEGQKVRGRVELTMIRGNVVARDGKIVAEPGTGSYVFR